jgi:hypothetical protein
MWRTVLVLPGDFLQYFRFEIFIINKALATRVLHLARQVLGFLLLGKILL